MEWVSIFTDGFMTYCVYYGLIDMGLCHVHIYCGYVKMYEYELLMGLLIGSL